MVSCISSKICYTEAMNRRVILFFSVMLALLVVALRLTITDPWVQQLFITPSPVPSASVLGSQLSPSPSHREFAIVKNVIDGDTIELQDGRKVRYIGMDTPETRHPQRGVECFGKEASMRNTELVGGKTIELQKDVNEIDRYGRLLRYVWVENIFVNKQLVEEGYAVASAYPPDIAHQDELDRAEVSARENQKGLWSGCPQ